MYRNIMFLLMYLSHNLVDLIFSFNLMIAQLDRAATVICIHTEFETPGSCGSLVTPSKPNGK
jgi:hypothetical protein